MGEEEEGHKNVRQRWGGGGGRWWGKDQLNIILMQQITPAAPG